MIDITEYFKSLLTESRSVDIAEREFKRALADDDTLRDAYKEWCEDEGYTEKDGFSDFCHEYIESRNEMWDSLTDYDNE